MSGTLRGILVLLLVQAVCCAAEMPSALAERLAAMRAAEAAVTYRPAARSAGARAARAIPAGPIATAVVTFAHPASAAAVPRFARVELVVDFAAITAAPAAFFEPDPLRGGIDVSGTFIHAGDGLTITVPGFWDGSAWRVRFAALHTGGWTYRVTARDASGSVTSTSGTFTCVAAAARGFIRGDGERFVDRDGQVFHGIGHNTGWQPVVEQPAFAGPTPAIPVYGTVPAAAALPDARSMSANGEDLLSFWLCSPWETVTGDYPQRAPLENVGQGIGTYNQAACAYLDGVVERAEAAGVRLLPSIWAHDQLRAAGHPWGAGSWSNNAYSLICGPGEFMTTSAGGHDTEQWLRQQAFYRYLLARWGASTAIIGWVGVVEMEGTSAFVASPATADAWCVAVRRWFADHDPYRAVAGRYPLTFSRSDLVTYDPGGALDLLATDSYAAKTSDVGVAATLASNIGLLRGKGVPCFHSEFGGEVTGAPAASQPAHLHNGLWADFAAGGALSPLLWCDGQSFPRLVDGAVGEALQATLATHARILAQLPFVGEAALVRTTASAGGITVRTQTAGDHGCAWILSIVTPQANLGGQVVTVAGVPAGTCDVLWFDTWSAGRAPQVVQQVVSSGSGLELTLPTLSTPRPDQFLAFKAHPRCADQRLVTLRDQELRITLAPATAGGGPQRASITRLPAGGQLFQVAGDGSAAAPITSVPTVLTDAQNRVLYRAPGHLTGDDLEATVSDWATTSDPAIITIDVRSAPGPSAPPEASTTDGSAGGCGVGSGLAVVVASGLAGLLARSGRRRR